MGINVQKKGFSRLHVDQNEILDYYNNKQVWLGVILKKKDLKLDNRVDNYEVVKDVVMRTVTFDKYAVDEFDSTKHKYTYCCVFQHAGSRYICPNSSPFAFDASSFTAEYVIVPYRMFFHDDIVKEIEKISGVSTDTMLPSQISYLIDVQVSKKTEEMVKSYEEKKARTRE